MPARCCCDNVYGPLDAAVCDQIVSESHGNPLALLELPRTWSAADLAGGFGLPGSQPVASKIEQSYVRRLRLLPSDTQLLVLAAAAEPVGDRCAAPPCGGNARHRHGCSLSGGGCRAAGRGLSASEFAHPLVRSATYRCGQLPRTGAGHIAPSPTPRTREADPDRRAWHRARATPGPDEEVAAELEHSAGRAQVSRRARGSRRLSHRGQPS